MSTLNRRLTVRQWQDAVDAMRHAEADWECWEADGDPSAKALLRGISVLRRLIDDRRPSKDWDTLSERTESSTEVSDEQDRRVDR